jgi:hypothetical protein
MFKRVLRKLMLLPLAVAGAGTVVFFALAATAGWPAAVAEADEAVQAIWAHSRSALIRVGLSSLETPTDSERAVWSALIDLYSTGPRGQRLPIAVEPAAHWPALERETLSELHDRLIEAPCTDPELPPVSAWAIRDFYQRAQFPAHIAVPLPPGSRYAPRASLYALANTDDPWERFRKASGSPVLHLSLSRVGFAPFGRQALVYVESLCGPLCGAGLFIVLENRSGTWRVVSDRARWLS